MTVLLYLSRTRHPDVRCLGIILIATYFCLAQLLPLTTAVGYTNITTSYDTYYISDTRTTLAKAHINCHVNGQAGVTGFANNSEYDALLQAMTNDSATYGNDEYWIDLIYINGTFEFTDESIESQYWYPGEPNQNAACIRMKKYSTSGPPSGKSTETYGLADYPCTAASINYICSGIYVPTSTVPATTIAKVTEPSLSISSGGQMSIVYIGLIIGGSLGLSVVCSALWLGINRYRKKKRPEAQEKVESDEEDT